MGFISPKGLEFGYVEHLDKYCLIGLFDTDTDRLECILLPERKRTIQYDTSVEIVKNPMVINALTILYTNSNTDDK